MNKIKLIKYFDDLISELDLRVETAISNNCHDENLIAGFNKQRDVFINEIRYVEAYNLRSLADLNPEQENELINDDLFSKFCFFIEFVERNKDQIYSYDKLVEQEIGLRLIITDKYLTKDQIRCFEVLFNHQYSKEYANLDYSAFFEEIKDCVGSF
jgi:hypothetical protein